MFIPVAYAQTRGGSASSEAVRSGLADKIAQMFDYVILQIPSWIAAFIVLVLSVIVAKLARAAVESRISGQIDEEHQEVLVVSGRITYVSVLIVGITVSLKIAGLDLTTILAAVAFGVGFALRAFIANFFAGIYILAARQFAIGDFIQVGAVIGRVVEIQSRATILKTYDGYKVIVPNLDIFTKKVTSLTTNAMRRIKVPLYISYDTDIAYAMKIALRTIKKHPKVQKKPKPTIVVNDYGDSTIDLAARFWVGSRDGWFKIRSDILHMLWDAFMKAGIIVPYNIMHLETDQDTAAEYKEFAETSKKEMERMKAARMKRKAQQIGVAANGVAPNLNGLNGNGAVPNGVAGTLGIATNVGPTLQPSSPQLVAESIPIEPPGIYSELEENDTNG